MTAITSSTGRLARLAALLGTLLASGPTLAQLACVTPMGTCLIAPSGPNGAPCYCGTPNGPVSGTTQMQGAIAPSAPPSALPRFCCTSMGKFGPFFNTSVPPGGMCQAMTPNGPTYGQACF